MTTRNRSPSAAGNTAPGDTTTRSAASDPLHQFTLSEADFTRVRELAYRLAGISLGPHKRDMVYSRLVRRLRALNLNSFRVYLDQVEKGGAEVQSFLNALTTNLTYFFREEHHFPILVRHAQARAAQGGVVRVWSAASSTGEEPYSMAIALAEGFNTLTPPVRLLATDIDTDVLKRAQAGIYPLDAVNRLPATSLRRFFLRGTGQQEGYARVRPEIQNLVTFRQLNLLAETWEVEPPLDAIFCRNVMIYFDKPTQREVVEGFVRVLAPDGLLFMGHAESLQHASDLVKPLGQTVYCLTPQAIAAKTRR
ncbi:chemotaxis protein methyltransferase [Gammaproteobacteria bacterium]